MYATLETADLQDRLKKIKLLALDIDGVMTDGRIFWQGSPADGGQPGGQPVGQPVGWTRTFHVKDGYGLKVLMKCGIEVAVISGGDSFDVRKRMEFLKIKHVFLGDEDKLKALDKILATTGLAADQLAFMGDDLFDIPVIERVGFSATVPHAVDPVKKRVNYITESRGGWGAVREVADAIRKAQGLGPYLE